MDIEAEYNKALDYLYSFVDYSLKHSSELAKAEFNLDRMFALMEELGNPQNTYPIIHVAGTKGKGSVSALCASALGAGGYTVGLYTSPHLTDYCERIQVNGEPISHELMVELVEEIKPAVAKIAKLTTFEITTALGLLAFAKQGCNAAVIEVGLGGRLDATNIVMPKVSVITSLSYDHMAVLGDTLAKIAGEAIVGMHYTTVAGPVSMYPKSKEFATAYKNKFKKDPEPFAAQAYDSAAIALKAIEAAIKGAGGKMPSRDAVTKEVRKVKYSGLTGNVEFDGKGDPKKALYFVIQVVSADPAKWGDNKEAKRLEIAAPALKKTK